MQGIIRNDDPIRQMYIFCPNFSRLMNAVHYKYMQPVEVPILEYIHNTNYKHKTYNLIENTPPDFSPSSEEQKIIKALELLWPLLQTKHITRLLAKHLTSSDTIQNFFPNGFFADDQ